MEYDVKCKVISKKSIPRGNNSKKKDDYTFIDR